MLKITTTDDQKGSYQSWTANTELDEHQADGPFSFWVTAYGATEKEALDRLQGITKGFRIYGRLSSKS